MTVVMLPSERVKTYLIFIGFTLLGEHYDVHRFHPPLVYGRRGNAENGEGISLGVGKTKSG